MASSSRPLPTAANMKFDDVKSIANGKVWTGQQALPMKLVDQVGRFPVRASTTPPRPSAFEESRCWCAPERDRKTLERSIVWRCLGVDPLLREKLMDQHVGFYYMWK